MPSPAVALINALAESDAALRAGDGHGAMRIVKAAQGGAPDDARLAARLVEACLRSDQLICAAHGTRTMLRHAGDDDPERCRLLGGARAFAARAAQLRWCPIGGSCVPVSNGSRVAGIAAGSAAALERGGALWSGENFVSTLKIVLADEGQWQPPDGAPARVAAVRREYFNHGVMHHMQGSPTMAIGLYGRALGGADGTDRVAAAAAAATAAELRVIAAGSERERAEIATVLANLAAVERGARARRYGASSLEAALRLAPHVPDAAAWQLELASTFWLSGQPKLARHAIRRALKAQPESAFGHALHAELLAAAHFYERAAASAAKADALEAAASPRLPACARWSALMPTLPPLWGARPRTAAEREAAYRELRVACPGTHTKLAGGGWHEPASLDAAPPDLLAYADASFDEVHWCAPSKQLDWHDARRVLRAGGLLQLPEGAAPPGGARPLFAPLALRGRCGAAPGPPARCAAFVAADGAEAPGAEARDEL